MHFMMKEEIKLIVFLAQKTLLKPAGGNRDA